MKSIRKISGVFVLGLFFSCFVFSIGSAQNNTSGQRSVYGPQMRGDFSYPHMGCPGMRRWQRNVVIQEFKGVVSSVSFPISEVKTDNGILYIRLGPWWYWQKQGYQLSAGEEVKITGYKWGNYVIPIKILTPSQEIVLRDERGFPMWRGGRRWTN